MNENVSEARRVIEAEKQARMQRFVKSREAVGLDQKEVARKLNATQAQVHAWEEMGRLPTRLRLNKLATLYGVTTGYLVYGTEIDQVATHTTDIIDEALFKHCFSFPERLKAVLLNRNMTSDKLALYTGIPAEDVASYLEGDGSSLLIRISLFADLLNVDRCALAFGVKK